MTHELDNEFAFRMLRSVMRPGRYLGNEVNLRQKPSGRLRFLICFPDLYEIGMSNLGLRILYHILNRHPDFYADIAFAPWVDMAALMRSENIALSGTGSGVAAREFEIVGFSLQHELQYTNVLDILDLSRIPILSSDRKDDDPVVIAGGPCAYNPEPMSDFIDAFAIGDGEAICVEMASTVLEARSRGASRTNTLEMLGELEGVYVPMVYRSGQGRKRISRRVQPELREGDFPLPPIVPIIPITHDRLTLEIMRGCTRGCRFCSAGMLMRPVRQRSIDSIVRLACAGIDASGWEEVSLVSLSTSDYCGLTALVGKLADQLTDQHVSISLPSMRPGTFSQEVATIIARGKKTGLTFAPEAGSARLRRSINKDIDSDELYATIETAFRSGWDSVKLYFMLGLPGEDDHDIEELVKMVRSVESICRVYGQRKRITVSISPFVPRPHTPFQWEAQQEPNRILRKLSYIRKNLSDRRVKLKWRDPYMSLLEGLLARGDRRFGECIVRAWKSGARFDGWTDRFDFGRWAQYLDELNIEVAQETAERKAGAPLPWDYIDAGISKSFLIQEARKAVAGELTPDCREGSCSNCGACPGPESMKDTIELGEGVSVSRTERQARPMGSDISIRFRIKYAKMQPMRFTSHLDVGRCLRRAMRRAGMPICYSQGFSPHPRVSFGPPLALGTLGEAEYLDVLVSRSPMGDWVERLNSYLPLGLEVLEGQVVARHGPSLMSLVDASEYGVVIWGVDRKTMASLAEAVRTTFSDAGRLMDFGQNMSGDTLLIDLRVRLKQGSIGAEKMIAGILGDTEAYFSITRKGLYFEQDGALHSPFASSALRRK